jgi:hypothetical protein
MSSCAWQRTSSEQRRRERQEPQRGYFVVSKDYSTTRARLLAKQVRDWIVDPRNGERQVGSSQARPAIITRASIGAASRAWQCADGSPMGRGLTTWWWWRHAELLHHTQGVPLTPGFDALPILVADDVYP